MVLSALNITIPFSQWQNANQLYAMELLAVKAASNVKSQCQFYDKQDVNEKVQVCHFTDHVEVVVREFDTSIVGQLVSFLIQSKHHPFFRFRAFVACGRRILKARNWKAD